MEVHWPRSAAAHSPVTRKPRGQSPATRTPSSQLAQRSCSPVATQQSDHAAQRPRSPATEHHTGAGRLNHRPLQLSCTEQRGRAVRDPAHGIPPAPERLRGQRDTRRERRPTNAHNGAGQPAAYGCPPCQPLAATHRRGGAHPTPGKTGATPATVWQQRRQQRQLERWQRRGRQPRWRRQRWRRQRRRSRRPTSRPRRGRQQQRRQGQKTKTGNVTMPTGTGG